MNNPAVKFCVLLAFAFNAKASEENNFFIDDAHFELNTESVYLKGSFEDKDIPLSDKTWTEEVAQTIELKYSSRYYNGVLGFDANYYGIGKINRSTNSSHTPESSIFTDKEHSFGKFGYSLNLKISDSLEMNAGRIESMHPLLKGDSDGLPALLQMASADYDSGQFSLHGIFVEKGNERNSKDFKDFGKKNWDSGEFEKKPIRIIGGEFYGDNYSIYTTYGNQEDISNYLLVAARYSYAIDDDLYFDFGSKYRRKGSKAELGDKHIQMISGQINSFYKNINLALSASKVQDAGAAYGTMGVSWLPGIIHGCTDESFYTSGIVSPGNHYGEATYKAELGYNFDDIISGMYVSAFYLIGSNFYDIQEDENEFGFKLSYDIPFVDGLRFEAEYGRQNIDAKVEEWDWTMDQHIEKTTVKLTYTALLF